MSKLERFDEQPYVEKLTNIQEINRGAELYETWAKNNDTLTKRKAELEAVTKKIESIDLNKSNILKKAKWPVEGLGIKNGEVAYEDVLFGNCGESKRYRISFAVAATQHSDLQCCRIDGAEKLGAAGRQEIFELAKQAGIQVLMSRVSDDGPEDNEIVIDEGVVHN